MTRAVVFSPEAQDDLLHLYDYIAEHSGPARASAYLNRVTAHCLRLADFPERGLRRDDLRPGLRLTGYQRRVAVAFTVTVDAVTVLRILYGGRDLPAVFTGGDPEAE